MQSKGFVAPYKVGGWDTDFASIRSAISGAVHRSCDGYIMPQTIKARLVYFEAAVEMAEREFVLLLKAMESQGISFHDI